MTDEVRTWWVMLKIERHGKETARTRDGYMMSAGWWSHLHRLSGRCTVSLTCSYLVVYTVTSWMFIVWMICRRVDDTSSLACSSLFVLVWGSSFTEPARMLLFVGLPGSIWSVANYSGMRSRSWYRGELMVYWPGRRTRRRRARGWCTAVLSERSAVSSVISWYRCFVLVFDHSDTYSVPFFCSRTHCCVGTQPGGCVKIRYIRIRRVWCSRIFVPTDDSALIKLSTRPWLYYLQLHGQSEKF